MKKKLFALLLWIIWLAFMWAGARLSFMAIIEFEVTNADIAAWMFLITTSLTGVLGLAVVMWLDDKVNGSSHRP